MCVRACVRVCVVGGGAGGAYESCLLFGSGHKTSSTQSSQARHWENVTMCAESTLGLIPPQCLRVPLPLLLDESCGRVVADHILSTATLKIIPRLHLERVCKEAGMKV